jgi:hypothetical protein
VHAWCHQRRATLLQLNTLVTNHVVLTTTQTITRQTSRYLSGAELGASPSQAHLRAGNLLANPISLLPQVVASPERYAGVSSSASSPPPSMLGNGNNNNNNNMSSPQPPNPGSPSSSSAYTSHLSSPNSQRRRGPRRSRDSERAANAERINTHKTLASAARRQQQGMQRNAAHGASQPYLHHISTADSGLHIVQMRKSRSTVQLGAGASAVLINARINNAKSSSVLHTLHDADSSPGVAVDQSSVVADGKVRNAIWHEAQNEWKNKGYWPNCEATSELWQQEQKELDRRRRAAVRREAMKEARRTAAAARRNGNGNNGGGGVDDTSHLRGAKAAAFIEAVGPRAPAGSVGAERQHHVPPLGVDPNDTAAAAAYAVKMDEEELPATFQQVWDWLYTESGHLFDAAPLGVTVSHSDVLRLFKRGCAGDDTLERLVELEGSGRSFSSFDAVIDAVRDLQDSEDSLVDDVLFYLVSPTCNIFTRTDPPVIPDSNDVKQLLADSGAGRMCLNYLRECDRQGIECVSFTDLIPIILQMHQASTVARAQVHAYISQPGDGNGGGYGGGDGGGDGGGCNLFDYHNDPHLYISEQQIDRLFLKGDAGLATLSHLLTLGT